VVELVHSMERGERSPEPRWMDYVSEAQTISATDS
jgi:2-dehydropantoate 2-reductase